MYMCHVEHHPRVSCACNLCVPVRGYNTPSTRCSRAISNDPCKSRAGRIKELRSAGQAISFWTLNDIAPDEIIKAVADSPPDEWKGYSASRTSP